MPAARYLRDRRRRTTAAVLTAGLLVLSQSAMATTGQATGVKHPPYGHNFPLPVPAKAPAAPIPKPLPKALGDVALKTSTPKIAAAPATAKIALRALVIATDANDWGKDTWKATLDHVGAAYDVLYAKDTALTQKSLVRADGTGKYNAILLASSELAVADANGAYTSAFTADEWNLLWGYERDFGVRQASLYTSYGTYPEDYCLRVGSEGGVGATPLNTTLTATGASVFSYLQPGARIPLVQSYVYKDTLAAGCAAQPILTAGSSVLGVRSTSTDGRERMALTYSSNQYLLQSTLLVYGMFRWAARGMFFGEQRHSLDADVDDWFSNTDELLPDGTYMPEPGYQTTAHDAYNAAGQQDALRARYPQASAFTIGIAFNGGGADWDAQPLCSPNGGVAQLTATTRCLAGKFRWINHTMTHNRMNDSDFDTNANEIGQNRAVAYRLGLKEDDSVLKSPEYSGLGVYNPDPNDDIGPPTDFGLGASNPEMLRAAKLLDLRYLHGNLSFKSQVPSCFNCGIIHPLEPALTVVPDWPTNIAYFSTTPAEETAFYNSYYGPKGRFPAWPKDLNYDEIIDVESDQALYHVATGGINTHTFHIGNLRDYGGGRTLLTDWADKLMGKYTSYYKVPLLSPGWPNIAYYASSRIAHFDALKSGVDAVYDRAKNRITVTGSSAGSVTVSGATGDGFTSYGDDSSGTVNFTANKVVSLPAKLLP
jgi:hypothetical protein